MALVDLINKPIDLSATSSAITSVGNTIGTNFSPLRTNVWSLRFDGNGDYVSLPSNNSYSPGTGDFTIEFWINFLNTTVWNGICQNDVVGASTNNKFHISYRGDTGSLLMGQHNTTNAIGVTWSPTAGIWYHVAVVRSSGSVRFYVNGTSLNITTGSTSLFATTTFSQNGFTVGAISSPYYMNGYISNFKYTVGTALYTSNFTAPSSPLSVNTNTQILIANSNAVEESVTPNVFLTQVGDAAVSNVSPFSFPTFSSTDHLFTPYFDGSGDYLTVPNSTTFDIGTRDFTIEFWVYPIIISTGFVVLDKRAAVAATPWTVGVDSAGKVYLYNGSTSLTTSNSITANSWSHIAITRFSGQLSIFINGITGYSASNTLNMTTSNILTIGGLAGGAAGNSLNGYISNLRIINGTAIYKSNFITPASQFTSITGTSLLTFQNSQLSDASPNAFTLTRYNGISSSGFTPFGLASVYFDGTGDYLTAPASSNYAFGTGDFTIECWAYMNSSNSWRISNRNPTGAAAGTWGFNISPVTAFSFTEVITGEPGIRSTTSFALNTWYHFAVTRQSGTVRLFLNGILTTSGTLATDFSNSSNSLLIGITGTGTGDTSINGYISNLRIIKGSAVYTASFNVSTLPLTAVTGTVLLACQNSQVADSSINAVTITRMGDSRSNELIPHDEASTLFNGTSTYLTLSSTLNLTGDFTAEALFFPRATTDQTIFYLRGNTSSYAAMRLGTSGTVVYLLVSTNGTTWAINSGGVGSVKSNNWNHVAVVRTGGTFRVYLNGVSIYSSTAVAATTSLLGGTLNYIGALHLTNPGYFFNGYISNARIVNNSAMYTYDFFPPFAALPPISGTTALTCQFNTIADTSSSINPISLVGGITTDSSKVPLIRKSYYLNGGYLTVPYSTAFNVGTGDFTVECWVYVTSSVGVNAIFGNHGSLTGGGFGVYFNGTTPTGQIFPNGSTAAASVVSPAILLNQWNHIALVRSSGSMRLYTNGVGGTAVSTSINPNNSSAFYIGAYEGTVYIFKGGYIYDFRFSKTAVYTANFTPPTTYLRADANTAILTCRYDALIDESYYFFNVQINSTVSSNSLLPFANIKYSERSTYFDGYTGYLSTSHASAFALSGTDFTIEAWINLIGYSQGYSGAYSSAICGSKLTNGNDGFEFTIGGTASSYTSIGFITKSGAAITLNLNGTFTFNLDTWYHVAITKSGSTFRLFVNGTAIAITTSSATWADLTNLYVATTQVTNYQYYFPGYISNLRILKGTALYTSSFTPSLNALSAISGTSILTCKDIPITDFSTNNLNIVKYGNLIADSNIPFSPDRVSTTVGQTYYFDGVDDYVTVPSSSALQLGTGDFTVECWVNTTPPPGGGVTMDKAIFGGFFSPNTPMFFFLTNALNAPALWNGTTQVTSSISVPTNTWTHVAWVRYRNVLSIFVNGIVGVSVSNYTTNFNSAGTNFIGKSDADNTRYYKGYLSNLRIIKGTALYISNFDPPTAKTDVTNTSLYLTYQKAVLDDAKGKRVALNLNSELVYDNNNIFTGNKLSQVSTTPIVVNTAGDVTTGNKLTSIAKNTEVVIADQSFNGLKNNKNLSVEVVNDLELDAFSKNDPTTSLGTEDYQWRRELWLTQK